MSHQVLSSALAEMVHGYCGGDSEVLISCVASLNKACADEISFIRHHRQLPDAEKSNAGIILAPKKLEETLQDTSRFLFVDDPYLAFAKIAQYLDTTPVVSEGIHESVVIHPTAEIGLNVSIGAYTVIAAHVKILSDTEIGSGCYVGESSQIGQKNKIQNNVTIYHGVSLGDRCSVHSNTVIGSDGFGYAKDKDSWIKIPQIGGVTIGNDVELGASVSIDRGALEDTFIDHGVIIDNQVHIAHNVHVGEHTAIAGCTGIAGSTKVGKSCQIAGQCAIGGHLEITDHVILTGCSMVTKSIKESGVYSSGYPVQPNQHWRRSAVQVRKLDELQKRVKELEKFLSENVK